jgi:transposase
MVGWFEEGVNQGLLPDNKQISVEEINSQKTVQKTVQKHFSNEMKIHFFNEDAHLPRKTSKCINSHLIITRTANEKPR